MRTLAITAALLVSAATSAVAQDKTPMQNIEEARRNERNEINRQYEAARRAREVPTAEVKVDPWANVRSAEAPPAKKVEKKRDKKPRTN